MSLPSLCHNMALGSTSIHLNHSRPRHDNVCRDNTNQLSLAYRPRKFRSFWRKHHFFRDAHYNCWAENIIQLKCDLHIPIHLHHTTSHSCTGICLLSVVSRRTKKHMPHALREEIVSTSGCKMGYAARKSTSMRKRQHMAALPNTSNMSK